MKILHSLAMVLFLACTTLAQDRILVNGNPPLTQSMVNKGRDFIEWLFEAPLTAEQRNTVEASIIESWKTGNKEEIAGTLELIKSADQIASLPEEGRAAVRAQVQPEVVAGLRSDPRPESRWMLAIYDASHKPIAPGQPALTRQMSDAQAEMFAFVLSEAFGQKVNADKKFLDNWAATLAKQYAAMNAAQWKQIANAPIDWANLRFGWSKMSEAQRAETRNNWKTELEAVVPQSAAQQIMNAAFARVEQIISGKSVDQVPAAQLTLAAVELEKAAAALSTDPAAESKQMAAQIKQTAVALRNAAAEKSTSARSATASSSTNVAKEFQRLQASQAAFSNMMNMSMQTHYTRSNSINILGGNPYRYVNSFGNPY